MSDELTSALEARVIEQSDRISALLSEKADATAWAKDEQHKRHAAEEKLLAARSKLEIAMQRLRAIGDGQAFQAAQYARAGLADIADVKPPPNPHLGHPAGEEENR